jgi:hypothetical protein
LRALGDLIHPKTNPVEQVRHRKAAFAHHLRKRLGVRRIGACLVRRHRSWRSVEGDQRSAIRLDKRQSTRKGRAGLDKRIGASPIKNDDTRFNTESRKRLGVVRNA